MAASASGCRCTRRGTDGESCGWAGGHPEQDGANTYSSGIDNNSNIPVETIESDLPLTMTGYGFLPGSGGDG